MEPTIADIQKWCAVLRSGKYIQGQGGLQVSNGHCCLGVACEIFIPKKLQRRYKPDGFLMGGLLEHQNHAPEWLMHISNTNIKATGKSLAVLNDGVFEASLNFDEIADVLEAVFIHKVLED